MSHETQPKIMNDQEFMKSHNEGLMTSQDATSYSAQPIHHHTSSMHGASAHGDGQWQQTYSSTTTHQQSQPVVQTRMSSTKFQSGPVQQYSQVSQSVVPYGSSHQYSSSIQRVGDGFTSQAGYGNSSYGGAQAGYSTGYGAVQEYSQGAMHTGYSAGTTTEYYGGHEYTVQIGERVVGTRVIGRTTGAERIISSSERVDESLSRVISEKVVEHEIRVPKKIIREEIIEKIIVVPEKIIQEEIVEGSRIQKERVIEKSKPIIVETVVEVPEIEEVEVMIEVPQIKVEERISYKNVEDRRERRVEVVKQIPRERIVEVPEIKYRDVPFDKIVEVPYEQEEIVRIEVPVPQEVEVAVPQYVEVPVPVDITRKTPVAIEAITEYEFKLPSLRPRYTKVTYPVYLPRFIEVPISAELIEASMIAKTKQYESQLHEMRSTATAMSLCEIETLAANIKRDDLVGHSARVDLQASLMAAWQSGSIMKNMTGMSGGYHATGMAGSSYHATNMAGGSYQAGGMAGSMGGASYQASGMSMSYPATQSYQVSAYKSSGPVQSSSMIKTSGPMAYDTGSTRTYSAAGAQMTTSSYSTTSARPVTPREGTAISAYQNKPDRHIASVVSAGGDYSAVHHDGETPVFSASN